MAMETKELGKTQIQWFESHERFVTESGETLPGLHLAYHTWGKLDGRKSNVVVICHALTGSSDAEDWFSGLFREDGFLHSEDFFVICINVPGSCYGSVGPQTINPKTGKKWKADFPVFTIRDLVRAQQLVLDHLGIQEIQVAIGGSLGGMQALEFALMDERVRSAAVLAAGARHEAWAIGISEAQRQAIMADANWKNGFYDEKSRPERGLAAARTMAMITYRTPELYNSRFSRETRPDDGRFQVESYLQYQGKKLTRRFDAVSYFRLTQSMDSHDVGRDRGGLENALNGCKKPILVVGIDSDLLYPVKEQKKLAGLLPNGTYHEIASPYGHDAFLIEFEQINNILTEFRRKHKSAG